MGQEYFINSQELENKVRDLLPSQGGAGAGFDLSASTQIIPIIDLTESAEGSNVRQDLQTAFSLSTITPFSVSNTTTTIINTTGYYRVYGVITVYTDPSIPTVTVQITDGLTTKNIMQINSLSAVAANDVEHIQIQDFVVFLEAGESLVIVANSLKSAFIGNTRQIASIDGTLTNP